MDDSASTALKGLLVLAAGALVYYFVIAPMFGLWPRDQIVSLAPVPTVFRPSAAFTPPQAGPAPSASTLATEPPRAMAGPMSASALQAKARTSTTTLSSKYARLHTADGRLDPALYDTDVSTDPTTLREFDPADLFGSGAHGTREEDHGKSADIARMYTAERFRDAHLLGNAHSGYLTPIRDGTSGMRKLGTRTNTAGWYHAAGVLRDQFAKQKDLREFADGMMVPIPEQMFDFMYDAASSRGIAAATPYDGIGPVAAGKLAKSLNQEYVRNAF